MGESVRGVRLVILNYNSIEWDNWDREEVLQVSRIVMISPYKDLTTETLAVAGELGVVLEAYEGAMEGSRDVIDRLTGSEIDVFVSRGGTAACIAAAYDIPVIGLEAGLNDVIAAFEEARRYGKYIAVTSFNVNIVGVGLLAKAMDIMVTEIVFRSTSDIEQRVADLADEGVNCIVGGGQSVLMAHKYGLPAVFLRTSRETIRAALQRAVDVARLRREEKRKNYRLRAILDGIYDGVVAVDGEGRVEIFNKAAERMTGLDAARLIGRPAEEVIPNTRLNATLRSGQADIGAFQEIGSMKIVTNRVPVRDENDIMGAVATFQDVTRIIRAEHQIRREMTKTQFKAKYRLEAIVGQSADLVHTKQMARSFANSDYAVLIYGASGTGKEMFAQGVHNASKRVLKPFVGINCAALPPTLLESELFGYDEGAFTGARRKGKMGLFELGHGGTVFLDEIDALPIELQGRLLRVLQEKEVLRVGGETIIPVNIRIIAATNRPPMELVRDNKMRADLFYRLNVLYLELPPLKNRKDDIPLLCRHFLGPRYDAMVGVLQQMMPKLAAYSWPGNVRELQNFCQRLSFYQENYLLGRDAGTLLQQLAPHMMSEEGRASELTTLLDQAQSYELNRLRQAVREAGSIRKAAQQLGMSKSALARRVRGQT